MNKRTIKLYEEFTELTKKKTDSGNPPTPPDFFDNDGGGDNDDDDSHNYPYYTDLIEVFLNDGYADYIHEVWNDEAHVKRMKSIKDTDFYKFCQNLFNKYRFNYSFFKKDIDKILVTEINRYNEWVAKYRHDKHIEKEFDSIMNTKKETIEDLTFVYKIEKPELGLIRRFISKQGETEAEANQPLLFILNCEIEGHPEPEAKYEDAWKKWVMEEYNTRLEKFIKPWADKHGYRLWSY
jgi:hypothetical protein